MTGKENQIDCERKVTKQSDLKSLESDLNGLKTDCIDLKSFAIGVRLIFSESKQEEPIGVDEAREQSKNRFTEMSCEIDAIRHLINDVRMEFVSIKDLIE